MNDVAHRFASFMMSLRERRGYRPKRISLSPELYDELVEVLAAQATVPMAPGEVATELELDGVDVTFYPYLTGEEWVAEWGDDITSGRVFRVDVGPS